MASDLRSVLMDRDSLSEAEVDQRIIEARERVRDGDDPEEVLEDEFGLEPDFVLDLLEGV